MEKKIAPGLFRSLPDTRGDSPPSTRTPPVPPASSVVLVLAQKNGPVKATREHASNMDAAPPVLSIKPAARSIQRRKFKRFHGFRQKYRSWYRYRSTTISYTCACKALDSSSVGVRIFIIVRCNLHAGPL